MVQATLSSGSGDGNWPGRRINAISLMALAHGPRDTRHNNTYLNYESYKVDTDESIRNNYHSRTVSRLFVCGMLLVRSGRTDIVEWIVAFAAAICFPPFDRAD